MPSQWENGVTGLRTPFTSESLLEQRFSLWPSAGCTQSKYCLIVGNVPITPILVIQPDNKELTNCDLRCLSLGANVHQPAAERSPV